MAGLDESNILLNGTFDAGLTDWNVTDISGASPPVPSTGGIAFNAGDDTVFGDAVDQGFVTVVGNTYSVTLNAREIGAGEGTQDFTVAILDDAGSVVETLSATLLNEERGE